MELSIRNSGIFTLDASKLNPLGFKVNVYPHNHKLGAEIFDGQKDKADLKYFFGNLLSGRNPWALESAVTLMCVAKKAA